MGVLYMCYFLQYPPSTDDFGDQEKWPFSRSFNWLSFCKRGFSRVTTLSGTAPLSLHPPTLPSPAPARLSRFTRCSVGRLSPSDPRVPTGCGGVMPRIPTRADPSLCLRPKHLEHCLGTHGPSVNICWTNKWTSVTPALNWKHPKRSGRGRAVFTHLC